MYLLAHFVYSLGSIVDPMKPQYPPFVGLHALQSVIVYALLFAFSMFFDHHCSLSSDSHEMCNEIYVI